jgi:hypothetical protein
MIKDVMRPGNAPCEDFNHEFCKLIITPELCNENYYINDRKAIESCNLDFFLLLLKKTLKILLYIEM